MLARHFCCTRFGGLSGFGVTSKIKRVSIVSSSHEPDMVLVAKKTASDHPHLAKKQVANRTCAGKNTLQKRHMLAKKKNVADTAHAGNKRCMLAILYIMPYAQNVHISADECK